MNLRQTNNLVRTGTEDFTRRSVLKMGILAAAATVIPGRAFGSLISDPAQQRRICVYNLHTKEDADIIYWENGNYIENAWDEVDHIFRDHYNGQVRRIDTSLLDFLYAIQQKLDVDEPFHLISGYRSRATNAMLRQRNNGVAKRSMHVFGKAADIRLPAVSLKQIRRAAYELKMGGVGYYPRSNFVHVDVGSVRFWRG